MVRPLLAARAVAVAGALVTVGSVAVLEAGALDEAVSSSTTSVRPGDAPGESVVSYGDAEVLGPPLQLEEPPAVLGVQVERPDEAASSGLDPLARTGTALPALGVLGLALVGTGVVLCRRAQAVPAVDGSVLTIRWVEATRPAGTGLTIRFLPSG